MTFRHCLVTVSRSKLWRSYWRSIRDWQALLGGESRIPNPTKVCNHADFLIYYDVWVLDNVLECLIESCKPNYCGIYMHGITVRTDMISELGIVLAWPCLDGIDVDCESLGQASKRRGLATRGTLGMSTKVVLVY
eukprot:Gb_20794 [translate_table: standard]